MMIMTHYMELLAVSPMHLILLMVLPMLLAELFVTTEIFSLIARDNVKSKWHSAKSIVGILLTLYYTTVVIYVIHSVLPTIQTWRGWADKWAIYSLLLAVIPLWALLIARWVGKNWAVKKQQIVQAILLVIYLVVAHLAMIFGMADPLHTGYEAPQDAMTMPHHNHSQMNHGEMMAMPQHDHNKMMKEEIPPTSAPPTHNHHH